MHEDTRGIEWLNNTANSNAATLNNLLKIDPTMDNEDRILQHSGKARSSEYVMEKFYSIYEAAREQQKYSRVEWKLPDDLIALRDTLTNISPRVFEMVTFENGRWIIDAEDLQAKIETGRFRTYASSPDEIARYNAAKQIADFINTMELDTFNRNLFVGALLEVRVVNGKYALSPNPKFVFGSHFKLQTAA